MGQHHKNSLVCDLDNFALSLRRLKSWPIGFFDGTTPFLPCLIGPLDLAFSSNVAMMFRAYSDMARRDCSRLRPITVVVTGVCRIC